MSIDSDSITPQRATRLIKDFLESGLDRTPVSISCKNGERLNAYKVKAELLGAAMRGGHAVHVVINEDDVAYLEH